MAKMVQVRNVPDRLHHELMRRAKARGKTLTEYLDELLERIASRTPVRLPEPAARIIGRERPRR